MSIKVAIIGAGPYGLSIAACLRAANVSCRIFGRPMQTWRAAMPAAMHLKSDGFASDLCAPISGGRLRDYCRDHSIPFDDEGTLVKLSTFVSYGLDFQARQVPDLDQRDVVSITLGDAGGYVIKLEDDTCVMAQRVILAVGVTHFARVPDVLSTLPVTRLTHSSAHVDLSRFAGKDVTVVGAGSSAVELAALLDTAGAKPRLLARSGQIRFFGAPTVRERSLWQRIRHPKSGLGPGIANWMYCVFPQFYRLLPASMRMKILRKALGPKSQHHLRECIESRVEVLLQHELEQCAVKDDGVEIRCRNSTGQHVVIHTDHMIAATGYASRLDRLSFIAPDLRDSIRTYEGYPVLSANFESSQPGLYFVGLAAAGSFGPLMRFVYGAEYTVRRLVAHLA